MPNRKTIFITVFQPFVSRNILNTGILNSILSKDGNRVVLFVPLAKEDYYRRCYEGLGVIIEPIDVEKINKGKNSVFDFFAQILARTNTNRFHVREDYDRNRNFLKYFFSMAVIFIAGHLKMPKRLFRYLDFRFNNQDIFGYFFDKYNPNVVFATNVFGTLDVLMIKNAIKHKIKNIGMVLSWDNNTSKGLMRAVPDVLIVQNEVIKNESISVQAVEASKLIVSGIAHYDYYLSYQPISRQSFCEKMNIDINKKIILISPAGKKFISTDWQILSMLKDACNQKLFTEPVKFLVRVHPTNKIDLDNFQSDENFIIEDPGVTFDGVRSKDNELDLDGVNHLIDSIHHSSLVINTLSSIVIDAAVLERPVITIGFDGWEKNLPFTSSIKRHLLEDNMVKLLASNGTRIANNFEELVFLINFHLSNPGIDNGKIKKMALEQCWRLDGRAKDRIASILSEV